MHDVLRVRRGLTLVATLFATLVAAAPAAAWEVRVSVVGSGVIDETTDANKLNAANCSTSQNTPNWTIGLVCYAGTPDGEYGHGWTVRYLAIPSSGWVFRRWQSDGTTRQAVHCDGSTSSTYTGTACQFGTYDNYQTQAVFEDVQAPVPSITSGPAENSTTGRSASFTFSATNNPGQTTTYRCKLTRGTTTVEDWTACSAGKSYASDQLQHGDHTFHVDATDPSGLNNYASRSWKVDGLAPETFLTAGPAEGSTVTQRTARFEFAATGEAQTFFCRLGSGGITACSSPYTTPQLSDGQRTFYVWAQDAYGNVESSPATRTWTIDGTAPDTTITGGPAEGTSTTETSATFTFSATEAATYRCSLDGAAPGACSSPHQVSGLAPGTHTLQVWATDGPGNQEASPATRTWTVVTPATEGQTGGGTGSTTATATTTPTTTPTTALVPPTTTMITPPTTAATLPTCRVPKLKGKTLRAARKALKNANCALGKVTRKRSKGARNRVIAQKAKPGTIHAVGKKVAVVLSKR